MACWCGHGPWHHCMYPYPPPGYYPLPEHDYGPRPPAPAGADVEELTDRLRQLTEEIARVRRDLDELRRSGRGER